MRRRRPSFIYGTRQHARLKQVATGTNAGTTVYLNDPVSGALAEKFSNGTTTTWRDYITAEMSWRVLASMRRLILPFVSAADGRSATATLAESGLSEDKERPFDISELCLSTSTNVNLKLLGPRS